MRIVMAAVALISIASAPLGAASTARGCKVSAFVTDSDPRGLNVRAGPSARARVIRRVREVSSGVAEITAVDGAWFRISGIVDAETEQRLFQGNGWVHQSLLGIDVANSDPRLYAAPSRRARVLAKLRADMDQVTLLGCIGDWARVRHGGRTGWLSPAGQCASPLTNCS